MESRINHLITGSYDPLWVMLSVIIAIIASYTALDFSRYITKTLNTTYRFWLVCGSISMGIGIWSMHFVGMLAFQLPLAVKYDTTITLFSLLVAVAISGFALFIISKHGNTFKHLLGGGVLMGLGIASMHYTGMASMMVEDTSMEYKSGLLVLSMLLAIVVSIIALWIASKLRDDQKSSPLWVKAISAIVMGFAIASMHYTGMAATVFRTHREDILQTSALSANTWLVATIVIATLLLLILSLVAIRVDQFITAQSEALGISNQRNKQIMDNADDTIVTIDENGMFVLFNRAGEKTFGYAANEMIGKNISCLMPDPEKTNHDKYLSDYKLHGSGNVTGKGPREVLAQHRNGKIFPIEMSVTEMCVGERHSGFIGIIRDITERKKNEEELKDSHIKLQEAHANLQESHQQLLQSEKMASIGQLAAGVAHEINNPIGYISSNIGTMQSYVTSMFGLLSEYQKIEHLIDGNSKSLQNIITQKNEIDFEYIKKDILELLNESKEGVSRVKNIVQDLKDFSHMGEEEWQVADLHKGINSTLNIVNNEIKYKADVIKELGDLPEVECIASQINQVVMNILINATHAIDKKGKITIITRYHNNNFVSIEIADDGSGISEESINKIFNPFYTTKEIGKGTGLGLSISYGIIQKHHGEIKVSSKVGEGTVFTIWLPVRQKCDHNIERNPLASRKIM